MNSNEKNGFLRRLFGGVNMTWPVVLLYAVGTALVTGLFLILPIFKNTSFQRVGETLEAWILFAIILMANCKTPLESAQKTFVFFLVSQPLIYLLQVPFSWQGWGLFQYYPHWFMLTLLTFPAAYVGWYITKRNWVSLVILLPVLCFLAYTGFGGIQDAMARFPHHLLVAVFCFGQIVVYVLAFTPICGLSWKR